MKAKAWNHLTSKLPSESSDSLSPPMTVTNSNTHIMGFPFQSGKRTDSKTSDYPSQSSQTFREDRVGFHESQMRIPRQNLRFSPARRASAALLSVIVCSTTLIYLANPFSTKLYAIESELNGDNHLHAVSISTHPLVHAASDVSPSRQIRSGRRLASTQIMLTQDHLRRGYPARVIDSLRQRFASMKLILSLLKHQTPQMPLMTFFGHQISYVGPLTAIPRIKESEDGYTTVISVYHVQNGASVPHTSNSLLGSLSKQIGHTARPSIEKASVSSVPSANAPLLLKPSKLSSKAVHADIPGSHKNEIPINSFKPTGLKERIQRSPSVTVSQRLKELNNMTPPVRDHPERGAEGAGVLNEQGRKPMYRKKMTFLSEDVIEIWSLHSGNSVCRIYNVGRLPEGRLVLPEWMKRHSLFLLHQCGVKEPVFAIKSRGNHSKFVFNKKRLNMTRWVRDINKANMDLFDANPPRHHMPHFVSDILFPLRATELLRGSGNGIARLSFLRRSSSSNSPEAAAAAFPDLKPSLFLTEQTWEASPSTWVRRLAKFFSHPEVKFSLLSEKVERRPSRRFTYNKNNLIWRFRSVLSSNLNPYEREGLFDTNGNNFVFSRNGLSGAPSLMIRGISQEPCRVSVTALTRIGPRALLQLDVLKKEATALFGSARLVLDFKIVKFENSGFDAQVKTMRETNVLIATHGAGNTNVIFMRRGATFIEVFPFAYRAGPFESFAQTFGLEYKAAMSAPQTKVFKECMKSHENNDATRKNVFEWWDKAVAEEKVSPWVHRLELEKEFGEPGKSEGKATRRCVRMQQLAFDNKAVAAMIFESAKRQCNDFRFRSRPPLPLMG